MERDERARNLQARQAGRQEVALIGRVQILQELSGLPSQSADELAQLSAEDLRVLELELQRKLRDRG